MNKKLRTLRAKKKTTMDELRAMVTAAETENRSFTEEEQRSYDDKLAVVEQVNKDIDNEERLMTLQGDDIPEEPEERNQGTPPGAKPGEVRYLDVFLKAVRSLPLNEEEQRALSSNTDSDGAVLIPQDIRTKIKEFMRDEMDMYNYVTVEPVKTKSGSRVVEKEAEKTPFEGVAELVDIPDMGTPQFDKITWDIQDFKGLMEIPNSLLKDEDANLMRYIAKWIAKKQVATHNALIFYADGTKVDGILGVTSGGITIETLAAVIGIKGLKTVINKTLPTSIARRATITTNQSGYNYLDTLEDANGKPYLQPDPRNASGYLFLGKKVIVFDDDVLRNNVDGKAPIIIGDPKEAYTYFDREKLSIATSKEAGFENDSTKVRAIMRGDGSFFDKKALHAVYTPVE